MNHHKKGQTTVTFKSSAPITLKLHLAWPMTQPRKSMFMYKQISVKCQTITVNDE